MKRRILWFLMYVVAAAMLAYPAWVLFRFWHVPGWLWQFAALVLIVGSGVGAWLYDLWQKQQVKQYLAGREQLTHEQFAHQFFPPQQEQIAAKVRQILSVYVSGDSSQLHPADRLEEDLRIWSLDSLADLEFVLSLEREFGITFSKEDTHHFRSIADVVDCVAGKTVEKE